MRNLADVNAGLLHGFMKLPGKVSGRITRIPDKWILLYRYLVMYEKPTICPSGSNA